MPEDLPDGSGVADVFFGDDEHLAEGAGEHVEVADGCVFAAVGGVEEAVEEERGLGGGLWRDGVGELVEAALFGGEDHGFYVAKGYAVLARGGVCGASVDWRLKGGRHLSFGVLRLRAVRSAQDDGNWGGIVVCEAPLTMTRLLGQLGGDVEEELFELAGDEHHVGAEGVD